MAQLNFNASTVKPQDAYDVLPPGWYNVRITESEMRPTKNGQGSYLSLTMTVIDGPMANRKLFDRLNINNPSAKAVEIAYQTLSSICHATGVIQLQDSQQLHGLPMQAKVKIRPAEGSYQEANEISGYKPVDGGGATAPQAAPSWAPPAQPAARPAGTSQMPPWATGRSA